MHLHKVKLKYKRQNWLIILLHWWVQCWACIIEEILNQVEPLGLGLTLFKLALSWQIWKKKKIDVKMMVHLALQIMILESHEAHDHVNIGILLWVVHKNCEGNIHLVSSPFKVESSASTVWIIKMLSLDAPLFFIPFWFLHQDPPMLNLILWHTHPPSW